MRFESIRDWQEHYARYVARLYFEPVTEAHFEAANTPILENPHVFRTRHSPGWSVRGADLIEDGNDKFSLLISKCRQLTASHRGREIHLGFGDAVLLQVDAPGRVGANESCEFDVVMISFSDWEERNVRPNDLLGPRLITNS